MLETFPRFRGEGFGLIVEDLLRPPAGAVLRWLRVARLARELVAGSDGEGEFVNAAGSWRLGSMWVAMS